MLFANRAAGGRRLAKALKHYRVQDGVLVLALPRGGVPVGLVVARALRAPLDIFLVRKLGVPGHEELAMGAIASGGVRVLNHDVIDSLQIPAQTIEQVAAAEQRELQRREQAFRGDRRLPLIRGRSVILVDDGLATGATMRAAIEAVREHGPDRIVAAVPVAPPEVCAALARAADEAVCCETPEPFLGVGRWYQEFPQLEDDDVRRLLARARLDVRQARQWTGTGQRLEV
jgi:predicted phosphoribosyltransferase